MTKSVKDIMTTRLQTIGMSETAKDAAKKMVDKNVSSLNEILREVYVFMM